MTGSRLCVLPVPAHSLCPTLTAEESALIGPVQIVDGVIYQTARNEWTPRADLLPAVAKRLQVEQLLEGKPPGWCVSPDGELCVDIGLAIQSPGWQCAEMASLVGMTFTSVTEVGDAVVFRAADGLLFQLAHTQSCCENVYVESIVGELSDLEGSPILLAEAVCSSDDGFPALGDDYSYTWTFFKLATRKGYVDIRFYGSSNGYYSEDAELLVTRDYMAS